MPSMLRIVVVLLSACCLVCAQTCTNPSPGGVLAFTGSSTLAASGGTGGLAVTPPATCAWAAAGSSWITITPPGSGTGNGLVTFVAGSNASTLPRLGFITVAMQSAPLLQRGTDTSSPFTDVSPVSPYVDFIKLMKERQITRGCTQTTFCPEATVTRGQAAVFIIRSLSIDNFPFPTTPFFTDVPSTHAYFPYIQRMRALGLTSGCTPTEYCPDDPVTRGQVAVFVIRAKPTTADIVTSPYFADVPVDHPYFSFIQKMKQLGITAGCSATQYCPDWQIPREQMAVFLMRAFFQTP